MYLLQDIFLNIALFQWLKTKSFETNSAQLPGPSYFKKIITSNRRLATTTFYTYLQQTNAILNSKQNKNELLLSFTSQSKSKQNTQETAMLNNYSISRCYISINGLAHTCTRGYPQEHKAYLHS
jgi:hypothetical protein